MGAICKANSKVTLSYSILALIPPFATGRFKAAAFNNITPIQFNPREDSIAQDLKKDKWYL